MHVTAGPPERRKEGGKQKKHNHSQTPSSEPRQAAWHPREGPLYVYYAALQLHNTTGRRTRRRYAATCTQSPLALTAYVYPVRTTHRLRSSDMPSKLRAWLVIREYGFGVGVGVGLGSCRVPGYGVGLRVRVPVRVGLELGWGGGRRGRRRGRPRRRGRGRRPEG